MINLDLLKIKIKYDQTSQLKGDFIVVEVENKRELMTFFGIFIFTLAFGLLLIIFLKKLKALTHGAEEIQEKFYINKS